MFRNAQDENREERRRGSGTCPKCGTPVLEAHHSTPWGHQTRLLVCPNPDCGKVAAEEERLLLGQFVAPCVRGGRVRTRVAGLVCTFAPRPHDFQGWGIFPGNCAFTVVT